MPIMSAYAICKGLRDRRRKMTQILVNGAWELQYWGNAETAPRVGRRRSQTLFSNTCQQRTCLNRSYKKVHESYNINRWIPSLRTT
jgi:hypothetical protein